MQVEEVSRCSPGNECRLTVENATKIESMESVTAEIKADIKGIYKWLMGLMGGMIVSLLLLVTDIIIRYSVGGG